MKPLFNIKNRPVYDQTSKCETNGPFTGSVFQSIKTDTRVFQQLFSPGCLLLIDPWKIDSGTFKDLLKLSLRHPVAVDRCLPPPYEKSPFVTISVSGGNALNKYYISPRTSPENGQRICNNDIIRLNGRAITPSQTVIEIIQINEFLNLGPCAGRMPIAFAIHILAHRIRYVVNTGSLGGYATSLREQIGYDPPSQQ
jgi:hypothetical protein